MKAILTYHSVDCSESPISVSEDAFKRHVRWLASGAVTVTTVEELLRMPEGADAVAITFDDGFSNFGDIAAPLLASHGLPSTLFVVTDHVGGTNAWGGVRDPGVPTLPLLDWQELARLSDHGVTLGAHTRSHRHLSALARDELVEEIAGSARLLEQRTGQDPAGFAYPYGTVSDEAAALVREEYRWGCTTELRSLEDADDRSRLPRLDMYYFRDRGRLETWGTARFRYYLKLRSHARRVRQRFAPTTQAP